MKRILFFLSLFAISFICKAQYPVTQFIGADSTLVKSRGGLQGRFAPIPFTDTTAANSSRISQYPGALIYTSGVDKYWYRNATTTGWVEFTSSGGATTNIYNSNGILTGDRNLDGAGLNLSFHTLSKTWFQTDTFFLEMPGANPLLLIDGLGSTSDTSTYKPMVIDATGKVAKSSAWFGAGGSSIDTTSLSNRINAKSDTSLVWKRGGNGGINPTTDWFGTADSIDVIFKTKNAERLRLLSSGGVKSDSTEYFASGEEGFVLRHRSIGLTLPVPTFAPKNYGKNIAVDIMPSEGATDYGTNGLAWLHIIDKDARNTNPAMAGLGLNVRSSSVRLGMNTFNGGTEKPLQIEMNTDTMTVYGTDRSITQKTNRFNISKSTASGDYTLLGLYNPTGGNTSTLFVIGEQLASVGGVSKFGFIRYNSAITPSALRDSNQLEIAANSGATGGLFLGTFAPGASYARVIKFGQSWLGTTYEVARFDTMRNFILNYKVGVGTYSPDAKIHIAAGSATAGTAPLKFTSGTPTTTPETGAMQFNSGLWIIDSSTSKRDTIATRSWARVNISGGGGSSLTIDSLTYNSSTSRLTLNVTGQSDVGVTLPNSYLLNAINADSISKQVNDSTVKLKSVTVSANDPYLSISTTRTDTTINHAIVRTYVSEPIIAFSAGGGIAADTSVFADSTLYGSFYTGQDSLYITEIYAVLKGQSGDTLGIQVVYNDTFNVTGTVVGAGTKAVNSRTTGNQITISSNSGIPPNNWIWLKSPTVISGKKPEYLSVTLIGYRKYIAP